MLFNSPEFAWFLVIVLSTYYLVSHKLQNRLLLVASYVFYGYWDWRFLTLIFLSSVIDYTVARHIYRSESQSVRKWMLAASITSNLGILCFFKYFNFFADSFTTFVSVFGLEANWTTLNIVLPVGISFYTFQTMSYTIDVYRKELNAVDDFFDFALYVAFFPQLVAGPIERAKRFLPQILSVRTPSLDAFTRGAFLILFGLVKKVAIADALASSIDPVFAHPEHYTGLDILLATYGFALQIYCDFSGYSDIARGVAKLMGFDLMKNFDLPYVSQNPQEFWRRWHISLSSWLRDYLYIPLGGNRKGAWRTNMNLMITMILGGLWHGAAWNFILWGAYQGSILVGHRLMFGRQKTGESRGVQKAIWVILFFHVTCFGWLLFRAESIEAIITMCTILLTGPYHVEMLIKIFKISALLGIPLLLLLDVVQYMRNASDWYRTLPTFVRGGVYAIMLVIFLMGLRNLPAEFIYFQF